MRFLGRWSLASFMKLAIDLPYYLLLVVIPAALVVVVWIALRPRPVNWAVDLTIPVRLQLDPASHPASAREDVRKAAISKAYGTLKVNGRYSTGSLALALIMAATGLGVFMFVLNRLRAVFKTLRDQNPFVVPNVTRIRGIGIALVLGQLLSASFGGWLALREMRGISIAGLTLEPDWSVNLWVVFSGLVLIVLSEVFRLGAQMKGDLETARKIQFDLVPGETFQKNQTIVLARMRPARTVGGDFYDVSMLDDRRVAVIVGDVTGKGLPAAMLMASVVGSARALLSVGLRGSELIAALNRHVCSSTSGGRFVTLFYGELDTLNGELTYVNAGHNPPILLRSDGRVERLQPTSMVVGVMADAPVESQRVEIGSADRLLLFTDGYSEAFDKREQEYGEDRLVESLVRARALLAPGVVERLIADVKSFCGSVPPRDDMTLMLVVRQAG